MTHPQREFRLRIATVCIALSLTISTSSPSFAQTAARSDSSRDSNAGIETDALAAANRATEFLVHHVSDHGGYLWRYAPDLSRREGEGKVERSAVWVQPPGTPTVGEAFLNLHLATGDSTFLDAAIRAGEALMDGQMRSGGWQASVEFDPAYRTKWGYRSDPPSHKRKDQSSLDDDKTQSALRFLVRLDHRLKFKNAKVHEACLYGLDHLIDQGQFESGGFPQVWTDQVIPETRRPMPAASYPDGWPREYPGHNQYWTRYTLNDHLSRDVIDLLFVAHQAYGTAKYLDAARRHADSILSAQMPKPQPAWAQQYSHKMQPIWARKFEPPAITSSESQTVIETLLMVHQYTGDRKYLTPIPDALDYLKQSELPDGRLARFYELKTNRPLYMTRDYKLNYDDGDVPTHYAFKVSSKVESLRKKYKSALKSKHRAPTAREWVLPKSMRKKAPNESHIRKLTESMDDRGAWLVDQELKYQKHVRPIIEMNSTADNLNALANYLYALRQSEVREQ